MPENFKRATGRPREVTDTVQSPTLDLTTLTDQEEKIIQAVIQKDEIERSILEAKINEVRKEIQEIRKAGALTAGDDQNAICARCKFKFLPFLVPFADHGQRCVTCKFRVCAKCRTQQPGGSWLCILCSKYRQEKQLTGEFMSKGQPAVGSLFGSDLLRASLRDRSHTRSGYEEAVGVNYVQRPVKPREVDSDAETPAASLPAGHAPEELRKEQSLRRRESSNYTTNKVTYLRHVTQSSHIRRAAYGSSISKDAEGLPATHPLQESESASASLADNVSSHDAPSSEFLQDGQDAPEFHDRCADGASFDESGIRKYCSDGAQVGHLNSTSLQHQQVREKRAFLNRVISISEQTLYYDDVKVATLNMPRLSSLDSNNMPRLSSLDSRSVSSLCSDYSINPKYRSLKPATGKSELELFRKRGERYSMRRKRTLEESQSEEQNDIKRDTPSGNSSIDSSVNQTSLEVITATSNNTSIDSSKTRTTSEVIATTTNNFSIDSRENQMSEAKNTNSNTTSIDSSENQTSEAKNTNSNNTAIDSNENQDSSEAKKKIPHWHEILRMQSVVEGLTKQNKSPTATSSQPLDEASEAVDQIFSLVKPKLRKTSAVKIFSHLTSSNSKDDSSSSQESISVYVASYMSPTTTMCPDKLFTSTPKTNCSLGNPPESKKTNLQISAVTQENATTPPNDVTHTDLNQSPSVESKPNLPRPHKPKRSYFSLRQSKNGPKRQDWRGKRKLPSLDRVTSLKREHSNQAKLPTLRRQDSYSQALETEEIPCSPLKGNTDRKGQGYKDMSSNSLHANAEADLPGFKQNLDSDTSSVASSASSSQHASRTNSIRSSGSSRSIHDTNSIHEKNVQRIVVRGNIPAVLPSKFRFRRSSSSLTESQRSDSLDSSSSYEKPKDMVESNDSKSPAVSRVSAAEERGVRKTPSVGGDGVTKAVSEENSETVNSVERNFRSRSASQDSFDDVYNSNASLFLQMMNSEQSAKDGETTKDSVGRQKRLLPQRPGEGKNLQIFLQKSVSLSEEVAENARFQSFDEGDQEVLLAVTEKAAKGHSDDILEEKLLLPSEIRKRQSSKDSLTSKDSSELQAQESRIPILKTPSLLGQLKLTSARAQTKMVPDVKKEETWPKANSSFGTQVSQANSSKIIKESSEVDSWSWLKKPQLLEVKQPPGVLRISQGRPEDPVVSLSRSGSNVSDAYSNVTERSELHGQAEKYDYGSDHNTDDTFHNSSLGGSFSDDDSPDDTTTKAFSDSVKPYEVMQSTMDHSHSRESTRTEDGRSKFSNDDETFQRTHEEDHDVKSDDSQLYTDHSGDRTSQMSNATEDSNPEGYFQERESSISCPASDLDHEMHSTLSRESTESYRDTHPGKNDQPSVSIQGESLEGVGNINIESERGDLDEECNEFVDKVHMEEVINRKNQSIVSSVLDAEGKNVLEQDALLLLPLKHPERLILSPTDHSLDSYLPDATMDLDCASDQHLVEKINNAVTNYHKKGANHRHSEPAKVANADGGLRKTEKRDVTLVSSNDRLSVPSIAVTNAGVEQKAREDDDEEDDFDELFNNHQPNTLLGSRSSLADSRESIYSVYSDAGEVNYGRISVTGEIMFKLSYNHKNNTLEVHIIQCKDLAPVDAKHNRSDPYVKTYLLPDKTRSSKRKTKIKKHTLSPIFDEVLKYQVSKAELETRSLWVTVWHNDRFGRNDFLGEVTIPLDYYSYNDNAPRWCPLQERTAVQEPMMNYRGDLFISLKFVTPDMADSPPKKKSSSPRKKTKEKEKPSSGLGEIWVQVKEAQNLTAMRGSAGSDPFCKGYLLPDESHRSKQKTPVVRKTTNPQWQHTLVFEGVDEARLPQHGLELTIWDYERLSSNDFLGGVRLNLGQGCHQGKPADWMDARGEEIEAWQSMMDHPNEWVDAQLPLRVSMSKQSMKK